MQQRTSHWCRKAAYASTILAWKCPWSSPQLLAPVTTACCLRREFYCHSIGHYLGLDVHDTNTVGPHRTLQPGMVLAIEPGLYIPDTSYFGNMRGIAVRIEDVVLVTDQGCEVSLRWCGGLT